MRQTLITPASLTSRIVESKIPDHLFHALEISIICQSLELRFSWLGRPHVGQDVNCLWPI